MNPATAADVKILATFDQPDSIGSWKSVNDDVMGGVSEGGFKRTDANTLLFTGTLSLENNGGFASIRTEPRAMDLTGLSALVVKARGDGRTYCIDLRVTRQQMASSYRAFFPTSTNEWLETRIRLSDFKLQSFGRPISSAPLDPAAVNSVGFTLADKKAGSFALEIESVKAVAGGDEPLTPRQIIELAIDRGVPLFNADQPAACVAVYEVACEALRARPDVTETARQDLTRALQEMRAEKSVREKAWILRRSLDRTFATE